MQPVAYTAKSLTFAEKNYVNIERELLAVLHSLEKFHHLMYTWHVHLITDHKPLLFIIKKDIKNAALLLCAHKFSLTLH